MLALEVENQVKVYHAFLFTTFLQSVFAVIINDEIAGIRQRSRMRWNLIISDSVFSEQCNKALAVMTPKII